MCIYDTIIFSKWYWGNLKAILKRIKVDYFFTLHKINSKWIEDVNVRLETIHLQEIQTVHFLTLILVIFFYLSPQAKATKANLNKWDYIKLKIFCTVKGTINKMKQQPTEWEKIVANYISHKGLISRLYKELIQLNQK